MIITPIDEFKVGSKNIAESNKKRVDRVILVKETNIGFLFKEFEDLLKNGTVIMLKYLLENKVFFEIIADNYIDEIIEVYIYLDNDLKHEYVNCLKESYIIRGDRGIRYSFTPIVRKYKGLLIAKVI